MRTREPLTIKFIYDGMKAAEKLVAEFVKDYETGKRPKLSESDAGYEKGFLAGVVWARELVENCDGVQL